jgi:hypothetical protein
VGNEYKAEEENNKDSNYDADINSTTKIIYEASLSRMFTLNRGPDITDIEKLRYVMGLPRDTVARGNPMTLTHVPRQPLYLRSRPRTCFCFLIKRLKPSRVNILSTVNS